MAAFVVVLEMLIDGAWLDITRVDDDTRMLSLDAGTRGVSVTRGRTDDVGRIPATTAEIDYLDNSNILDGENPLSPHYRKIGPATPVRLTVDGSVRCEIELAALRTTTTPRVGTTHLIQHRMEIAGQTMRLEGANKPVKSAATRRYSRESPWQWWAMETGTGLQVLEIPSSIPASRPDSTERRVDLEPLRASPASAGGDENARASGVVSGGTTAGPPGSAGGVDVSGGGQLQADFALPLPPTGLNDLIVEGAFQFAQPVDEFGAGSVVRLHLTTEVTIQLFAQPVDVFAAMVFEIGSSTETIAQQNSQVIIDDGDWHHVIMIFERTSASTFDYAVYIDGTVYFAGTTTNTALYDITQFTLSATGEVGAVTQWAIWKDDYLPTGNTAGYATISGYTGQTPGAVIQTLLEEAGINFQVDADDPSDELFSETIEIKSLAAGSLMDQVSNAAFGGQHLLFERRDGYDTYVKRPRTSLYNQVPRITLSYAQLLGGFTGEQNAYDQRIINDQTITNDSTSGRFVIPDDDPWHWTTQAPPTGAGVRDVSESAPIADEDLRPLAAWIAHVRSWREKRYLNITVELAKDATAYPDTGFTEAEIALIRSLDIGDVIAVDTSDAPATIPYDELRFMIQGYVETITLPLNTFTFNLSPADIWEVEVTDFGPTAVIANVIDDNDTSIKIAPGDGPAASEVEDFFHIAVNGDPMTVTSILTETPFHVATGALAAADNASVVPALPGGATTADVGQVLLILAAARGTGAAVPVEPAGWETVWSSGTAGEIKMFGKYYVTGDAAPTITMTGGAAGTTLAAVMASFSRLSLVLDKNLQVPSSVSGFIGSVNASAQNIAFSAFEPRRASSMTMIVGKKDDDWTGVAIPSGYTEVADLSSTLGNDIGLAWYSRVSAGTTIDVAAGSLVVSGGAAAASVGVAFALRPLQTATVTRAIAGLGTSHTAGETIHAWRPGVGAL